MDTRIAWSVVFGCALVVPSGCSRGAEVGFTSFGSGVPGQSAGDDDDDDEDGGEEPEEDDGAGSTSGPSLTTGPLTSSTDPGPPPDEGPPGPMGAGDCCVGHGGLGCDDPAIESCVCAQDDFCCTMKWDDLCVSLVAKLECGVCGDTPPETSGASMSDTSGGVDPGTTGSDGDLSTTSGAGEETGSGGGGDCCTASDSPGCGDAEVESCVCAQDDYCCDAEWDSLCVDEVEDFACGSCGGAGESTGGEETGEATTGSDMGTGDCCTTHGPGCTVPTIETCVCSEDAYCCDTAWDSLCVSEVDQFGCGICP